MSPKKPKKPAYSKKRKQKRLAKSPLKFGELAPASYAPK